MTLCGRLIGGAVNLLAEGFELFVPFWQTPREVEWAKAAADGLAEREAEVESRSVCPTCDWAENPLCSSSYHLQTFAPTPGAVDGPAEGSPDKPSAVVDECTCPWVDPELWTVHYGAVESGSQREFDPSCPEHGSAFSAEVEPPASAPSAESPAPEFDWVTAAIPVIAGVLSEHIPNWWTGGVQCFRRDGLICGEFADWADWRNHVAPHIAVDIQSDCLTTRPRPIADSPKHRK